MWYRLAVTIGMKAETMAISIARSRLASMIAGGEVAGTPEEVAALLRDNAEAGFGAAAYAQVLLDGRGTPRNVAEGVLWLARTARAGDANVAQTLADGWADGRFGAVDVAQSERWRAWHAMLVANNGLPMSTIAPPPGPPPPLPRGIDSRLDALCDDVAAGRALGFIHLGAAYERGQLVPVDYARAEYWYTRAAAMGSPTARWALGAMIVNGFRAGTDGEAAVLIAEGTAGRGITDGEAAYGWILMTGRGLPRDETEAVYWMRRAARHGDPFGEYLLGIALLFGHGIARDEARGLALIEQAADDGYVGPLTRPLLRGEAVADPW
jgi:TPR repeat protein